MILRQVAFDCVLFVLEGCGEEEKREREREREGGERHNIIVFMNAAS